MAANPEGIVTIHGKQYQTVGFRVSALHEKHENAVIIPKIVSADDERVVVKATIYIDGEKRATGHAEEVRGSSNINTTSALENCETSAVGRALAFLGMGGTEIASADEVANAIKQQHEKEILSQWATHTQTVEDWHEQLKSIRQALLDKEWQLAKDLCDEIDHDTWTILWRATTKGGWFTTKERDQMKHFPELIDGRRDE